jgi:Transposase
MAARLSAKKLTRYSLEFKQRAVRLTEIPGLEVQVVAEALDLHPVMLSRWRQEAREGRLRGSAPRTALCVSRPTWVVPSSMTGSFRLRLWCRPRASLTRDPTIASRSFHTVLSPVLDGQGG